MKKTMNKRDIAKYHKLLAEEIPLAKISKAMQIDPATLKKFTPEKVAAAKGQEVPKPAPKKAEKE